MSARQPLLCAGAERRSCSVIGPAERLGWTHGEAAFAGTCSQKARHLRGIGSRRLNLDSITSEHRLREGFWRGSELT